MKKIMLLIISVLLLSCTTQKTVIVNDNSELKSLLETRFSDYETRNEVYNDIIDAFYTTPNINDSILVLNKDN